MEKLKSEQIENKEKFGENVELIIDLIRHAEKEGLEGGITRKGEEEASEYGHRLRQEFPESSGIKIYHSGTERAERTSKLIKDKSRFKERERKSLTLVGKLSQNFGKKLVKLVNEQTGDETKAIQAIINPDAKKPDEETKSSKELSQDIAKQLLILIRMSENFKENSKFNIVLVSHSGMIENFLADVLNKERENFLEDIGGPLNFLESIRITANRHNKSHVDIKFKFRDYEFDISQEDLENINKK